jgi:hypothetical protein
MLKKLKKLVYTLTFVAMPIALMTFGPSPIKAQEPGDDHPCPCNAGCATYYHKCDNGLCSLFCHDG